MSEEEKENVAQARRVAEAILKAREDQLREEQLREEELERQRRNRPDRPHFDLTVDEYHAQTLGALELLKSLPIRLELKVPDKGAWGAYSHDAYGNGPLRVGAYLFESREKALYAHGDAWRGPLADEAPFGVSTVGGPDIICDGVIATLRDGVVVNWGACVMLLRYENLVWGFEPDKAYVAQVKKLDTLLHPAECFPLSWVEKKVRSTFRTREATRDEEAVRLAYFFLHAEVVLKHLIKLEGNTLDWALRTTAQGLDPLERVQAMLKAHPKFQLTAEEILRGKAPEEGRP